MGCEWCVGRDCWVFRFKEIMKNVLILLKIIN
jgi:hypothetical protein